jgi:hypothetical protein
VRRRIAVVGAIAAVLLGACDPGAREAAPFQGVWHSAAWGMHLAVNGGSVAIFESSSVHCVEVASGGARGLGDVLGFDGEDLILTDAGRIIRFEAEEFLPTPCAEDANRSADAVFDVAVATFEAHYARDLDPSWSDRVAALRPSEGADDAELRVVLQELLGPLDRPDVRLVGGGETWSARATEIEQTPADPIVESLLDGEIGYLAFRRLGGFDEDVESSQRVVADAIDRTVGASPRLILDLRASVGGSIDHAMLIASRFVPAATSTAELWTTGPGGPTFAGGITVQPLPTGAFAGNAAVLIGPGTVGVAELLAAALADLPGVTLIGRPTAGAAGPGIVRFLPNGWSVGLPNLRVVLADGTDLSSGVSPDIVSDEALATARETLSTQS